MKRKLFLQIFTTYLIVLLLPFILVIILTYISDTIGQNEAESSNQHTLSQIAINLDSRFQDIIEVSGQIAVDQTLNKLLRNPRQLTPEDIYDYTKLIDSLKVYNFNNFIIHDFFIYVPSSRRYVTQGAIYQEELFYSSVYQMEGLSFSQWKEIYASLPSGYQSDYRAVDRNGDTYPVYIHNLYSPQTFHFAAQLVVLLDNQKIKSLLPTMAESSQVLILDYQKKPLLTASALQLDQISSHLTEPSGREKIKIDNEWHYLSWERSDINGFTYILMVPQSEYLKNVNTIRDIVFILIVLFLLTALLLTLYITRRSYRPMHRFLQLLNGMEQEEPKGIDALWQLMQEKYQEYAESIENQRTYLPQLKSYTLQSLFYHTGEVTPQKFTDTMKLCGVELASSQYVVAVLQADQARDQFDLSQIVDCVMVKFIMENVAVELFESKHVVISAELNERRIALVVNQKEDAGELAEQTYQILLKAAALLEEKVGVFISAGIGNRVSQIEDLSLSFEQAANAQRQACLEGCFVTRYKKKQLKNRDYYISYQNLVYLENTIKTGDRKQTKRFLEHIFNEPGKQPPNEQVLEYYKMTLYALLHQLELETEDAAFINWEGLDKTFGQSLTAAALIDTVTKSILDACSYFAEKKANAVPQTVKRVLEYVDREFCNAEFSQSAAADALGLTAPYISFLFREYVKDTMVNYVNRKRVEKAKILMQSDPSATLSGIAEKVGLINDIRLIKVFKKYEGITPGAFKASAREERPSI